MAERAPFAQWRARGADVVAAADRVRRRDLRVWRDRPTWIENSGFGGSDQLVAWSNGRAAAVSDGTVEIGSALYGYGAPSWTPLPDGRAAVLARGAPRVVALDAAGRWGDSCPLGDGVAAGYVTAFADGDGDGDGVVAVVDRGRGRGRALVAASWTAPASTLYETAGFIGDLAVDPLSGALAWVEWPVGALPWEAGELVVARRDGPRLALARVTAPGPCAAPTFANGALLVAVEVGEWFTPHRVTDGALAPLAVPPGEYRSDWSFGRRWVAGTGDGLVVAFVRESQLGIVRVGSGGDVVDLSGGLSYLYDLAADDDDLYALASTTGASARLWRLARGTDQFVPLEDLASRDVVSARAALRRTGSGVPFVWRSPAAGRATEPGDRPGLVAVVHGGPAAYAGLEFSWIDEVIARCGLAIAHVDYRGSTSYGRSYRQSLWGRWGVDDVADVCAVIDELVESGEVDPARVFVRGSSAGGLTALLAARDPRVVGVVVVNPVTDLAQLAAHESEFEEGDLARLVGAPVGDRRYRDRSPSRYASSIAARVLVVRGLDDTIVPPDHAREFVARLRAAGTAVTDCALLGDGHSIRRPENVRTSLWAEVAFYGEDQVNSVAPR